MASEAVLDLDRLLAPIPGDNPAGADLRLDPSPVSDYQSIRSARKAAVQAEKKYDQRDLEDAASANLPAPDWRGVFDRSKAVLAGKSKDLEVAAYLIEALVRLHGFAGLRDGFKLARGLVETYWEGLYPGLGETEEESRCEFRFAIILCLNGIDGPGTLAAPVRKVRMTDGKGENFSFSDLQIATSVAKLSDPRARQARIDEGAPTIEGIKRAVAETPAVFYADLAGDIAEAREAFLGFARAFLEKSSYDAQTAELVGTIDSFEEALRDLAREKLPSAAPSPAPAPEAGPDPEPGPGAAGPAAGVEAAPGAIRGREDALAMLTKAAEYFRRHEPQSIIPYALEQVVSWGRMPLPELLTELIPDDGPRRGFFKQVGIKSGDDA